ncbi:MAG: zinc ribbon domain-containing protein [Clostridiales bacterium]|nr:zinc ribbon domain-containing protein [Clostridiales bacterium]
MGKNYFQAIPIEASYDKKLIRFSSSLGDAIGKGVPVPFADNDVTYTLDLQNRRIKEKNIELDYEVYKRTNDSPLGNTFFDVEDWNDGHYKSTVGFAVLGVKRRVRKNNAVLYKDNLRRVFYGTVTDIISGSHPDNESYTCPNCGAVSTIADLQNGCPYCGTQYKMDDLFPKITSFYFFDQLQITKKQLLTGWPVCALICIIAIFACEPFFRSDPMFAELMKSITQYGPLFVIVLGSVYGIFLFLFMHLLFKIARAIVDLNRMGTAESRTRFEHRMKKITPEFSFEYFKNKAISLIKTAVYSGDETELLCYKGEPLPEGFKDIIDLNYAGTFGIKGLSEENGIVTVETRSYFDVLSVKDDKVSFTQPVISATFQRRTDIPVDLSFSIHRIDCPSCAKSFNPVKNKFCPGCGKEYELITDDWVLVDLKMMK